jgi:hypothetical protein
MAATAAWTLGIIVVIDIAINQAFRYPATPGAIPGALQQYFDYGRSVHAKLARHLRPDGYTSPVGLAGWLPPPAPAGTPPHPPLQHGSISFYGMSFTNNLAEEIRRMDPNLDVHTFGGPAAPPNHVFANFERRRSTDSSSTVILGILASSTYGMTTMTGASMNFEGAAPFTYPRFRLPAGSHNPADLTEIDPVLPDAESMRKALQDPVMWEKFSRQLREQDRFYSLLVFETNLLDRSALFRGLRRGYASGRQRDEIASLHGRPGEVFGNDEESRIVLAELVRRMAADSRSDGRRMILVLLHDRGFTEGLHRVLAKTIEQNQIECLSSETVINSSDALNFQDDGHYSIAANRRLAEALLSLIKQPQ